MKKVLTLILLLSIAPAIIADSCCPSSSDCCPTVCEVNCQPSGCCPENCDDIDPCDCIVSSRSFFSVRPQFQGASPEKVASWRLDRMYERIEGYHGTFQIVPFGGRSGRRRRMATYFTPNCLAEFTVTENFQDVDGESPNSLMDAKAFGIQTVDGDFKSRICFRPQQSTAGVGLSWRQKLSRHDEEKGFWFETSFPITHVRNKMGFEETVDSDGSGPNTDVITNAQPNMTTAFQQAAFRAGRIPCDCGDGLTETGVADVDIRVGYGWRQHEICHLESYIGVLAPTGNSVDSCYLFEPIVGSNKHVGFEFGSAAGYRIWANEEKEREAWVETAVHSVYRNKKTQRRSFDLKHNPWSRYLPMYASFEQASNAAASADINEGVPGINVLTDDVRVEGRYQRTYNTAFVFQSPRFSAEVGYNFFCRDAECVELCNWCGAGAAIKHCGAQVMLDGEGPFFGATNKLRKINACNNLCDPANSQFVNGDLLVLDEDAYNDNRLTEDDLDLHSAAAPCMTQHTFYANLGYRWDDINYPTFVSAGGSYEFASDNTGMNRWLIWGKIGMSY